MRNTNRLAFGIAMLVVAIWSETFISSKILLNRGLMPADIFVIRFLLAYLLMWIICPTKLFADSLKDELRMLLLGMTGGSLYFMTENSALSYSTASNVAIIVCSAPVLTAILLSAFYKDERMNLSQIFGSCIAFVGMILIIYNGEVVLELNPKGDVLALAAALTWGLYSLMMKKVSARYSTRFITRKVFAYGLLTILPYLIWKCPLHIEADVLLQPLVWGNLAYLGIVASMGCFIAWNWCLARLGTVRTTNLIYCQPFFTMLVAFLVLHERITWMAIAGTVILTVGMILSDQIKEYGNLKQRNLNA